MKLNERFPSPWLKGTDIEGPEVLTVERVDMVEMRRQDDKTKQTARPVVYFVDHRKGLILTEDDDDGEQKQSRVCKQLVVALGTDDTEKWPGLVVELYPDEVKAFGKVWPVISARATTARPATPAGAGATTDDGQGAATTSQPSKSSCGPANGFPASLSESGRKMANKVREMALEMAGTDTSRAKAILQALTRWQDREDKEVAGLVSVAVIKSENHAKAVIASVAKRYDFWQGLDELAREAYIGIILSQYRTTEDMNSALNDYEEASKAQSADPEHDALADGLVTDFDQPVETGKPCTDKAWEMFVGLLGTVAPGKDDDALVEEAHARAKTAFGNRYTGETSVGLRKLTEQAMVRLVRYLKQEK
jgi:hypothetical protein